MIFDEIKDIIIDQLQVEESEPDERSLCRLSGCG